MVFVLNVAIPYRNKKRQPREGPVAGVTVYDQRMARVMPGLDWRACSPILKACRLLWRDIYAWRSCARSALIKSKATGYEHTRGLVLKGQKTLTQQARSY